MEEKMEVRARNVKQFVRERKIKGEEIEKVTGWSHATVFRKLRGESPIMDESLVSLGKAFSIDGNMFDLPAEEFDKVLISTDASPRFIENVNNYIKTKKIKKENIARRAGYHRTTLDRYLSGEIKVGSEEMIKIADALRKTVEYFTRNDLSVFHFNKKEQLAFFSGSPSGEQIETAKNLIEFIRYHDALLSLSNITIEKVEGDELQ